MNLWNQEEEITLNDWTVTGAFKSTLALVLLYCCLLHGWWSSDDTSKYNQRRRRAWSTWVGFCSLWVWVCVCGCVCVFTAVCLQAELSKKVSSTNPGRYWGFHDCFACWGAVALTQAISLSQGPFLFSAILISWAQILKEGPLSTCPSLEFLKKIFRQLILASWSTLSIATCQF